MFQLAKISTFVLLMASMSVADEPESKAPISVIERLNALHLEHTEKLGKRIEECDAIAKQIQSGQPIQLVYDYLPVTKLPLPFCVPPIDPQLDSLESVEFKLQPIHINNEKIFPSREPGSRRFDDRLAPFFFQSLASSTARQSRLQHTASLFAA